LGVTGERDRSQFVRARSTAAIALAIAGTTLVPAGAGSSATASARIVSRHQVLRVGTYHGIKGQYRSLQSAVNAAHPGDWILVGPGDHKTKSTRAPKGAKDTPAGVLVTTPDVYIRGMNRSKTIIDGTVSGPPCSTHTRDQDFGPKSSNGGPLGRNGIMVWKSSRDWVQNLTVCNFLGPGNSSGDTGNEIWWNDGADSGKLGPGRGYLGSYMTTTSTYYHGEGSAAQYGIFSSNWRGGTWNVGYASNFNDSGLYIGACRQACDQVVNHVWAEYDALGYSGSNSGGRLIIKNSQFDHNEDGFDTNSQNGDNPPPQNGDCPNRKTSPITHTRSCWVFMHNYVHDNNNPNVPTAGYAAAGPVGTGMSISGGRNDTVMDNVFKNNMAWGNIFVPFPDSGPPCTGGTNLPNLCLYDESGDAMINNRYANNGGFGNPTNGDYAAVNLEPGVTDCFRGNKKTNGKPATASPADAESAYPTCTGKSVAPDTNPTFLAEVACDSTISIGPVTGGTSCPPGSHYPRQTKVVMHPLPGARPKGHLPAIENPASAHLKTMPNPCKGVPANPWCPKARGSSGSGGGGGYSRVPGAALTTTYARLTSWVRIESRSWTS
jgi:hypothetical protein